MQLAFFFLLALTSVLAQDEPMWRFNRCPEKCQCAVRFSDRFQANLRTVDCAHQQLKTFPAPEQIPSDVQVLILKDNQLRRLKPDLRMWFPDLLQMDMSQNRLRDIPSHSNMFEGVYNLRILDLSRNRISTIKNNVFQGLFNLEELDLSQNLISAIIDDAFRGLMKLETLTLSQNKLTFVQNSWFQHTRTLYNLYLDRNYLNLIQSDTFKPLHNLLNLDLSKNKIFRINDHAFYGLGNLENLQLASNSLTQVPRNALSPVHSNLKSINLSRNPIFKLRTDDFAQLPGLKDISLTSMQRLRLVERGAFKNLPELLVVQLHDNPYFAYLDSFAFVNSPEVTHLLLHNNNLTVLEKDTLDALPSLEQLSFYGNPLSCDCNARWLRKIITQSRIVFQEAERMVCNYPAEHKFKLFTSLLAEDLPKQCAPRILYMFDSSNARKMGQEITYDCRAIGVPKPQITWVTPEGRLVAASNYHPRRVLRNGQTLELRHIKPEDEGIYTCIAESDAGSTASQTQLNVTNIQVEIFPIQVSPRSITVAWKGADRSSNIFQILYRELQPGSRHQYAGTVTPIMKSYSVGNLQPNTNYELCIAFEDGEKVVSHISCTQASTKNVDFLIQGIERTSNVAVGAALGVIACMLIVICLAAVGIKRSRAVKIRSYDSIESLEAGVNKAYYMSAPSLHSVPHHISTDNIYSPLVSYVCVNQPTV